MAQPQPPPAPGPSAAPPPYAAPYPPPYAPPPPYYPPPPKSTNVALIIVIVIVLVVAITVVLAAVLYFMVSGLISTGGGGRPTVFLGPATLSGATAAFNVEATSRNVPFGDYTANLLVNTTVGTGRPVSASFTITVGTDSFQVTFTDVDANGLLSVSDQFHVTATGGWRAGTEYQFELLWTDLSPVAFVSWNT